MSKPSWYSKTGADRKFATKEELDDVRSAIPKGGGGGVKGDKGDPGDKGEPGPPGKDGRDGVPGASGSPLAVLPLRAGQPVPTVGFFGDSWSTESTMGEGFNLPAVVSRLLGCAPMVSAVDGSGFAYSASGRDGFEVDARVNAVCAASPNLIITIGSLNADKVIDNGDSEGTKITEAVKNFVTKVRAKLPQVPIIMLGPEPSSVTRLLSRSAHVNAKAQKAGVDAVGGLASGVAFVDWLGVADRQAVPWRDGRQCTEGDVVVYGGVAYRVTRAWTPEAGQTPLTAGAPVIQVSDVLSGTGNSGSPRGDGTRDTLLLSDDTHPTKIGAAAFGAAAAKHLAHHEQPMPPALRAALQALCQPGDNELHRAAVAAWQHAEASADAVAALASWAKAQGPVIPAAPAAPPTPQPHPGGDGLPVMAWLPGGWGTAGRVAYSMTELRAVAALKPTQVALPIQSTADAADSAVAINRFATPADAGDKHEFSQYGLGTIRGAGVDVAGMNEALELFEGAGAQVLPNVRTGLIDSGAEYYKSSDGKIFGILGARAGKTYQSIHGRGQSKLREIMKTEYVTFTRVVDATDATADWQLTESVKDAQKGVLASAAGAGVWGAAKTVFPDGVWALVSSRDEQETAKVAAQAAGVTILGWAAPTAEALAALKG